MANLSVLTSLVSEMFGVIDVLIEGLVNLLTGNLLVLIVVGLIVSLIVAIIVLVINYLKGTFKSSVPNSPRMK